MGVWSVEAHSFPACSAWVVPGCEFPWMCWGKRSGSACTKAGLLHAFTVKH